MSLKGLVKKTTIADAYAAGWDGNNEVPTKNDVYDEVQKKLNSTTTGEPSGFAAITNIGTISKADHTTGPTVTGTVYLIDG